MPPPQLTDALGMPVNNQQVTGPAAAVGSWFLNTATMLIQQGKPAVDSVEEAWKATKAAFSRLGVQFREEPAAETPKGE